MALPLTSRISVSSIPDHGIELDLCATDEERRALAGVFGVEQIPWLKAQLALRPWRRRGVIVTGVVEARVVQICVVTLDPFESDIRESVHEAFWPEEGTRGADREVVIDAVAEDEPEPFSGGEIDLEQLVRDVLAMAIDPYPRKPGASLDALEAGDLSVAEDGAQVGHSSPFAAIAKVRSRDGCAD